MLTRLMKKKLPQTIINTEANFINSNCLSNLSDQYKQLVKEVHFRELDYDLEVKRIKYNFWSKVISDLFHFLPILPTLLLFI